MPHTLRNPGLGSLLINVNLAKKIVLHHLPGDTDLFKLQKLSSQFSFVQHQQKYHPNGRKTFLRTICWRINVLFPYLNKNMVVHKRKLNKVIFNLNEIFDNSFIVSNERIRTYSLKSHSNLGFHQKLKQPLLHLYVKNMFPRNLFSNQVTKTEKTGQKEELEENWGGPNAFKLIVFIQENFDAVINKHPSILVFFSAGWCQHCLKLRKPYGKAALMAKEANLPIVFATFDITINPDIADEKGVVGIPTLKYYKNGKFVSNFKGKRTADEIFDFVKNPPQLSLIPKKKADV